MIKPKYPSVAAVGNINDLQLHVISCSTMLARQEDYCHEIVEEVITRVKAEHDRIQGNRSCSTPMTWHDLRLMFAATLRECLKDLEGDDDQASSR